MQIKTPNQRLSVCLQLFLIILLYQFQSKNCKKERKKYVTRARQLRHVGEKRWSFDKGIHCCYAPNTPVFLFCALLLLLASFSWSTALSRWMCFVNVDFCQVSFCHSWSKRKNCLWVAAMQVPSKNIPKLIHFKYSYYHYCWNVYYFVSSVTITLSTHQLG